MSQSLVMTVMTAIRDTELYQDEFLTNLHVLSEVAPFHCIFIICANTSSS